MLRAFCDWRWSKCRCWSSDEWIGSHRSRATQIQFQKHRRNLSECQRSSLVFGFFKIQLVFNYSWWKNRHRPSSNLSSTPESASNGSSGQIAQCDGSMAMVQINSSSRSLPLLFWSQGKKEETKTLAHQDELVSELVTDLWGRRLLVRCFPHCVLNKQNIKIHVPGETEGLGGRVGLFTAVSRQRCSTWFKATQGQSHSSSLLWWERAVSSFLLKCWN